MRFFKFIMFIIPTIESVVNPISNNFCKDCKHFRQAWYRLPTSYQNTITYAKCGLFPTDDLHLVKIKYLVDGKIKEPDDYYLCSLSRTLDSMCGEEGKYFKEK